MTVDLSPADFPGFFFALHGHEPFPWQTRLLDRVASNGKWPSLLDLPTGSGKTATIDVAVFHLALEADREGARRAPCRIAFVVDRRLIVDEADNRARKIAGKLSDAAQGNGEDVLRRVAARLATLAECNDDGHPAAAPLLTRRLRGGAPLDPEFVRTPTQPIVLASTVDQIGSRLLFRGYGVSDRAKPIHAGLLGGDCLILLDEAHLAEPFKQTLIAIRRERDRRQPLEARAYDLPPWQVVPLSATPGSGPADFGLEDDDRQNETLRRRLDAPKPAVLEEVAGRGEGVRVAALVAKALKALAELQERGVAHPSIAVVVNRVARARAVFEDMLARTAGDGTPLAECQLIIGPSRPLDRESLNGVLDRIKTGVNGTDRLHRLDKPLFLVATQTIEAGVDIDLDALVTDLAPLDALRQRFGRLDRDGRLYGLNIRPAAAIIAHKDDLGARADPLYEGAMKATWAKLAEWKAEADSVDFGILAMGRGLGELDAETAATLRMPRADAPVLMPAYVDLWSQTSPLPAADPEPSLFLHGPRSSPEGVRIVWRADLAESDIRDAADNAVAAVLELMPPQPGEAIEISLAAAKAWLRQTKVTGTSDDATNVADVPEGDRDEEQREGPGRPAFRWAGAESERTRLVTASQVRPGDLIVVPAEYGGCDAWGWKPASMTPVVDRADDAQKGRRDRRRAVRVSPALIAAMSPPASAATESSDTISARLANALGAAPDTKGRALLDLILSDVEGLPEAIREALTTFRKDAGSGNGRIESLRAYGSDAEGQDRGVVFSVRLRRLKSGQRAAASYQSPENSSPATEDDVLGDTPGFAQELVPHLNDVARLAERFGNAANLPKWLVSDLRLAGQLHDLGKADPRFQTMLNAASRTRDPDKLLAKSDRRLLPRARAVARERAKLPEYWRHEALSVRLAPHHSAFKESANDRELVLWLIGVHHGYGRPFFPHADELDAKGDRTFQVADATMMPPAGAGPQSLAYDHDGFDWPALFARLRRRYGAWELARLETIIRLADHRASERAGDTADEDEARTAANAELPPPAEAAE